MLMFYLMPIFLSSIYKDSLIKSQLKLNFKNFIDIYCKYYENNYYDKNVLQNHIKFLKRTFQYIFKRENKNVKKDFLLKIQNLEIIENIEYFASSYTDQKDGILYGIYMNYKYINNYF